LTSLQKHDCLVSYFRPFGFGSFRVEPRKELNSKI
jgi:hypothetical protein